MATLKDLDYPSVGLQAGSGIRMVKMVEAQCEECQRAYQSGRGWWNLCLKAGHDPYRRVTEITREVPVTEEIDGEIRIVGSKMVVDRQEALNLCQVAVNERINNGQGVERARQQRGARSMKEMGYHPICEYRNCWKSRPKVKTVYGNFCSEGHARPVAAEVEGMTLDVGDSRRRAKQLRGIELYAK